MENNFWIILDYGDIVAHIFLTEYRSFYRLEELWADAPQKEYKDRPKTKKTQKDAPGSDSPGHLFVSRLFCFQKCFQDWAAWMIFCREMSFSKKAPASRSAMTWLYSIPYSFSHSPKRPEKVSVR